VSDTGFRASIDDLLRYVEEPEAPTRPHRTGVRWAAGAALLAGALTALTVFGLRLVGLGISVVAVFAGFLALLLVRRVAAPLRPPPGRTVRRRVTRGQTLHGGGQDSLLIALRTWEERLSWADAKQNGFARILLPPLRELVDERLRQRHGITRASEPDRARVLLGERLWMMLEGRVDRAPTAEECAAIVSRLENI
jgi:hypothetical protein